MKQFSIGNGELLVFPSQTIIEGRQSFLLDYGNSIHRMKTRRMSTPDVRPHQRIRPPLLQRTTHSLSKGKETSNTFQCHTLAKKTFYDLKNALVVAEMQILKRLEFNVHVGLPYDTLINYLHVLGLMGRKDACAKAWGYLNDALQTQVYALYVVSTIVNAAILLTSRQLNISLPSSPPNCW
ncbi:hypothetical protein DFH29DRAFT_295297 [Suillus ampliporus]|nr:hypothetical protein DFH29DRAFT_295297 [Suillus ampliporus]